MIRIPDFSVTARIRDGRCDRTSCRFAGRRSHLHRVFLVLPTLIVASLGVVAIAHADTGLRIAVAPFAGERGVVAAVPGVTTDGRPIEVSDVLAELLAQRPIERVIAPDAFVALPELDPAASTIRQWAYNASVDTVVVGQVRELDAATEGPSWEIEAVLRSGHSGAESGRRRVIVSGPADMQASLDLLATDLLGDLGYEASGTEPAEPHRDPRSPEPPAVASIDPASDSVANSGIGADFDLGRLREDTPIEINAEEAEIVDRGAGRKLVFQRNVRVRQGDVRLASDVLEAEYRKGESEPDRLVARGSVKVDQGYRHARCDEAVYARVEQTLSCQGRAELVQGCDVVRGDAIEFDLAGDQAHVIGAASIVIRPTDAKGLPCASMEDSL